MKPGLSLVWAAGALVCVGCQGGERYRNLVDPCKMERYGAAARQEVITAFTPQVHNGLILDQTVWNYHFEREASGEGTDRLTESGKDKLDQLVRRRPEPDPRVFLATARDLVYNADKPDDYSDKRRDLDGRRSAAIQKYLSAQTAGRPMQFDVLIHDPADPAIPGVSIRNAIVAQRVNYTGGLSGGAGTASGGGMSGGGASGGQGGGAPPAGGGAPGGSGSAPPR
jgi:uncharacterized membrane protein YgcG